VINITHGGTFIPDIPTFINDTIIHRSKKDRPHIIITVESS
jgi:hypothetical protein